MRRTLTLRWGNCQKDCNKGMAIVVEAILPAMPETSCADKSTIPIRCSNVDPKPRWERVKPTSVPSLG
ncbi:hypothetical protein PanWU01x14_014240 [Parasponia andersonii]|uniref:Uncharacterized protein n=1 Tax=Parasponia andersonii TaxID=3476 RepID=A0A2P5E060_PARAD|nr:hypothetical protein PanWU01x14_014240 [Parasponia andersonii]